MDFTMQGLVLCLLVALATCENYEPGLNPKKTYEYKYEGMVNIGRGKPNLAESGVRMTCKAKIIGVSAETFILQVSDLGFQEFNGIPGKSSFNDSPKLTRRIADQLVKPFMFGYAKGRVGDIHASAETSDTIVNIVRGILGFFQVTVKATQRIYELEEVGIHGLCQSTYAIEEVAGSKELAITQTVDINNCREKAVLSRGMALALVDKISKERGESIISTVSYVYNVSPTADGGLITKAHALELQHFSPFNVKGGSSKLQAMKELVLLGVTDTVGTHSVGPMLNRGSLVYKFKNALEQIPILLKKLDDPVPRIAELIKRLAQANIYHVDNPTSEDVLEVYQLLRVITLDNMEALWKQFSGNMEHRRWFLDMIVEITDARILKFLANRFRAADVSANEAGQRLLISFMHLTAEAELVEMAKEFLSLPFSKSHPMLWNTVMLAYGSLVYKYCAYTAPCPVTAVQPLLDLANDALKRNSEVDMVIALKALGNAGHPSSIKTIIRFLPGVAATHVDLPASVLSAAVQSMEHLAVRDPASVQDIALSLFVQRQLPTEIRMLATRILFATKPPLALVSMVTTFLLTETDLQVASFTYSLMRGFAESSTPDNLFLSIACKMAVKILAPKFGRLSYHYSKAMHLDLFNDDFLFGTAAEVFMLKTPSSNFPTAIMANSKFNFLGRILPFSELGVRAEGIKELFENIPNLKGALGSSEVETILSVLQDWEKLPVSKSLLSVYAKFLGQEWAYVDIKKEFIANAMKAFSPSAGKESLFWPIIETLQKGWSWHWTKAFLIFETRYIQATTLGLPLEISKYYSTVTAITVNAKVGVSPALTDRLGQLLTSDVSLETDGFAGFVRDLSIFHGINTDLFQCGSELKSKNVAAMPWTFSAKLNVKQKKFELDIPFCKKETEFLSATSNVFAVSRNIEELALAKMTPMMPDISASNLAQQQQIVESDIYQLKSEACAEARIYGAALCLESDLKRDHFTDEYPLSIFLGYSHFSYKLQPVQGANPAGKIHIEINAGPSKHPVSVRELLDTLRRLSKEATRQLKLSSDSASSRRSHQKKPITTEVWKATPEPLFSMKALAIGGSAKPEGYAADVYYTPAAQMDNTQLIVSQVGEEANWMMCTDANVDKTHGEAKIHLRWGVECQSYEMSMKAATAHLPGSKPTLRAKMHWANVPEYMRLFGKSVKESIPGVALHLGFYQKNDKNTKQEVSASIVAVSPDIIDMKIKFPELTVYRQTIPMPVQMIYFEDGHMGNSTLDMA